MFDLNSDGRQIIASVTNGNRTFALSVTVYTEFQTYMLQFEEIIGDAHNVLWGEQLTEERMGADPETYYKEVLQRCNTELNEMFGGAPVEVNTFLGTLTELFQKTVIKFNGNIPQLVFTP